MATQNAARAQKGEIVDEVKTRMGAASAQIVSEYRGLTVAELAELRTALEGVGADYRIFKNTLVLRAIDGGDYQPLSEYLSGPTALTFVDGDISAVAKALRDFSRANPLLVIKGGLADGSLLSSSDLAALADLPPREVLLARLAGALAAPMQQMAGLLQALPRNLAYGMKALIDQRVEGGEAAPPPETEQAETADVPAAEAETPAADAAEVPATEASGTPADAPATATAPAEAGEAPTQAKHRRKRRTVAPEAPAPAEAEAGTAEAAGEAEGGAEAAATSEDAAE